MALEIEWEKYKKAYVKLHKITISKEDVVGDKFGFSQKDDSGNKEFLNVGEYIIYKSKEKKEILSKGNICFQVDLDKPQNFFKETYNKMKTEISNIKNPKDI